MVSRSRSGSSSAIGVRLRTFGSAVPATNCRSCQTRISREGPDSTPALGLTDRHCAGRRGAGGGIAVTRGDVPRRPPALRGRQAGPGRGFAARAYQRRGCRSTARPGRRPTGRRGPRSGAAPPIADQPVSDRARRSPTQLTFRRPPRSEVCRPTPSPARVVPAWPPNRCPSACGGAAMTSPRPIPAEAGSPESCPVPAAVPL